MTPGKSYLTSLDWFARGGAVVVASVGFAVICGWLFDIPVLKGVAPGLATMKFNTACAFLAAGAALWLLHTSRSGAQSLRLARALAAVVATVGGLSLAEDLFALDLGIDQLFVSDTQVTNTLSPGFPGRMAPATALSFFMLGVALLALKARGSRFAAWAHWLVVPPLFVSTLAVVGYAYGVSSLYEARPFASMAVHTALAFFLLALSILAADSAHGFASIAASDTAGGVVSRRLLPTLPFILFLLGWVRLSGQEAGMYDTRFGLALMVVLSITVCVVAVASTAITLHKIDVTRQRAEVEIMSLNAGLEQRVQERTEQLAQLSEELRTANSSLEQISLHDGLTHLANRRFFDAHLAAQIAIADRHHRTLGLVLCDVDAFKAYNDHYGHQAGDECLKQVAAAIRSCCRRPADMAARYGGEEFAMILPDTDLGSAAEIAEAAREAVSQLKIPHEHSPASPYVSISGGIAVLLRRTVTTAQQLITAADACLYEAKHLGRNRMVSAQAEAADNVTLTAEGRRSATQTGRSVVKSVVRV